MTPGRALIWIGLIVACLGVLLVALEKLHLPFGRLPGDLVWRRGSTTIYVPLATCLLLSLAASLLFWLMGKR